MGYMLWLSISSPSGPRHSSPYCGEGWLLISQLHPLQELPLAKENHLTQVYNPAPGTADIQQLIYSESLPRFTSEGSPSFRAPCGSRGPCCNCLEVGFLSLTHPPSRCVPENTLHVNLLRAERCSESVFWGIWLKMACYKYLSWLSFTAVVDPVGLFPALLCWVHMPVPQLLGISAAGNNWGPHWNAPSSSGNCLIPGEQWCPGTGDAGKQSTGPWPQFGKALRSHSSSGAPFGIIWGTEADMLLPLPLPPLTDILLRALPSKPAAGTSPSETFSCEPNSI